MNQKHDDKAMTGWHDETPSLPCAEKMAFDDRKQAQAAATVALHQHGTRLRVYRCRHCVLWHLASAADD